MSAVVNSSTEFICSTDCVSNVSWSYLSSTPSDRQSNNRSLLVPACRKDERCQVKNDAEMGYSFLSIDRVQFSDSGTYLCSAGTVNQRDYCEMSFQLTVSGSPI